MKFERSAGILLHPTSLPGPYGIGDLGPEAYRWVDFLHQSDCGLWQVLPLGPTGYGDSPYQCFSAFAGNPYLISPDALLRDGLLTPADLASKPDFPAHAVDFGPVIVWKLGILDRAYQRFQPLVKSPLKAEFAAFCEAQADWLEDYALFMALKDAHNGAPWSTWQAPLRQREPQALQTAREQHAVAVERQKFFQFLFFRQWNAVRAYANQHGIKIIGDIPIFVAHDSAEVWANPQLFFMDEATGQPTVVAGVPPDYFSATGQRWGNPLYRWDDHAKTGYKWWLARIRALLGMVDIIRLDHFRGFAGYWEIPAGEQTAVKGKWVAGPRAPFFEAVEREFGGLPILAEDLGEITPDVVELRDRFNLPGMKILVFAFTDDSLNPFLLHNFTPNSVVYTGTHDNDTAAGWFARVEEGERDFARRYLGRDGSDIAWDLIRAAWGSVSVFALAPMQDLLSLGNEARMNYPGRASGNWSWRIPAGALSPALVNRLKETNTLYLRGKTKPEKKKVEPAY
ncbi:MAG: 4-alpha-glucanotransferase [Anaerolineales bacterium]